MTILMASTSLGNSTSTFSNGIKLLSGCLEGKDGKCTGEGFEIVTATGSGPGSDDEVITITASCPTGKKVIAGGGNVPDRTGPDMHVTAGSQPNGTTQWQYIATCFSTGAVTCTAGTQTAYAICTY